MQMRLHAKVLGHMKAKTAMFTGGRKPCWVFDWLKMTLIIYQVSIHHRIHGAGRVLLRSSSSSHSLVVSKATLSEASESTHTIQWARILVLENQYII